VTNSDIFAGVYPSLEQIQSFSESLGKLTEMSDSHPEDLDADSEEKALGVDPAAFEAHAAEAWPAVAEVRLLHRSVRMGGSEAKSRDKLVQATGADVLPEDTVKKVRLSQILDKFVQLSQVDKRFHMCNHRDMMIVANWLHTIPLTLPDRFALICALNLRCRTVKYVFLSVRRFLFATAPVSVADNMSMTALYTFAAKYAAQQPVALNVRLTKELPRDLTSFGELCMLHNVIDLYLWLGIRFPKNFIEMDLCLEQKRFATQQIEATLRHGLERGDNSHSRMYLRLRQKISGKQPAHEYPHIRDSFLANIAKVPHDVHFVDPYGEGTVEIESRGRFGRDGRHSGRERGSAGGKFRRDDKPAAPASKDMVVEVGEESFAAHRKDRLPVLTAAKAAAATSPALRSVLAKHMKVKVVPAVPKPVAGAKAQVTCADGTGPAAKTEAMAESSL
jgi:hypothetical protein